MHDKVDITSFARKSVSVFATNWGVLLFSFIISVVSARLLGAKDKGILTLLLNSTALIVSLGQLGTTISGVYFLRQKQFEVRNLIASHGIWVMIITLFTGGFVIFFEDGFRFFFKDMIVGSSTILFLLLFIPVTMLKEFIVTMLLGLGKTHIYGYTSITTAILNLLGLLFFVGYLKLGVYGALVSYLISNLVALLGNLIWIHKSTPTQTWSPSRQCLKALLGYGSRHHIGSLGAQVFKRADAFLLAYFVDVTAVGYYSVSLSLFNMLLSVPKAVNTLLVGEASDRNRSNPALLIARIASHIFWIMLAISIPVALLIPWLIPWLYGDDFVYSVAPLWVLLPASVLLGFSGVLAIFLVSSNRPATGGVITLFSGVCNLLLSILLIPIFGIVGTSLATLVGSLIYASLQLILFKRLSGLEWLSPIRPRLDDWIPLLLRSWQLVSKRSLIT